MEDCIKNNLKAFKIPLENWETLGKSRCEWRHLLKRGAVVSEKERFDHAELKRSLRTGNMSVLPDDVKSWKCEICARILLSKAGYGLHQP